ncbi:MAG: cysteine--1-D-myo-inosityl 2-amino-2-deoxy-alpha-D-glucopyranoside ligase, partial [Mycobacteriales bacterium]
MRSWTAPQVPTLPGRGIVPLLHDSASGARVAVTGLRARLYVCGVTPYDATHLGHAATYVTFDVLLRAWRDAGLQIGYVQNVTDVDDPLLVRATRDGRRWQDLAAEQIELFRTDMAALRVIPPDSLVGAVEAIPAIMRRIQDLVVAGSAYSLDSDVYYSVDADQDFGYVSHLTDADMVAVFAANGGDPERVGKKNPLDPLLWRGERPGEPAWESPLGRGRPGWHIECATIALDALGSTIDVQGGGRDLVFPHHEMSAANAETLTGVHPFAACYTHVGMVRLGGDKMSKSRGNLEFVHRLLDVGTDPLAIRLALLAEPYGSDRDWNDQVLAGATDRLTTWRLAVRAASGPATAPV